ncbi:hypothetical protein DF105_00955 [Burkholderia stagnalis]|uniref:spike base protein, RCAP_Rcc01079 family n=1 Tax=Burkholderia stagnalis TaxID=1503054 RepID=UPI000F5FE608|nr:hypothetical protein [Burkholderia stagnalis]RQZ08904.1 hypothetical protein DF105_00955 [Burkholderia stagnalis]
MANHAQAVTPSDSTPVPATAYLSFTNSGTQVLVIDTVGGEQNVSITLPSGMYPIRATKIHAASTVTNIVAYWD